MSFIDKLAGRVKQAIDDRTRDGTPDRGGKSRQEPTQYTDTPIEEKRPEAGGREFETWNRARAPGRRAGRSPFG